MYQFFSPKEFADKRELIRAKIWEICRDKNELLYVALNEAVNNAFIHGYAGAAYTPVELLIYQEKDQLIIRVRHEGQGLQIDQLPEESAEFSLEDHGRGIGIIRRCADFFEYTGDGRELIIRKIISPNN